MKNKTYIIAEAGVNHNGDFDLARKLIDSAKEANADAVKFQLFDPNTLVTRDAPKAEYQKVLTSEFETQYAMLDRLKFDIEKLLNLKQYSESLNIDFMVSVFCLNSFSIFNQLNITSVKIPSGEITNYPLLIRAGSSNASIIISTGAATLGEIEFALACIAYGILHCGKYPETINDINNVWFEADVHEKLKRKISILHCCSQYPAPFLDINLNAITTIRNSFKLKVGYSDHTIGIHIPMAAVTLGAEIIEKHFTIDKNLPGPDHKASIEPEELKLMVNSIRDIEDALGNGLKIPSLSEKLNRNIIRKSVVAQKIINENDFFNEENIILKRSNEITDPFDYFRLLGKKSNKNYNGDERIIV